jgi:hypothetical protein
MLKPLLLVGCVVRLKKEVLDNPIGALGVVYEGYKLADRTGVSIIFSNGAYDGFSPAEQDAFLEYMGHNERLMGYDFKNVTQLMGDFSHGMFDAVLKHQHFVQASRHENTQS